jgi:NAD kinase
MGFQPAIAIVTTQTRLKGLLARWGTRASAKFRLNQAQAIQRIAVAGTSMELNDEDQVADDFEQYEEEDHSYNDAIQRLRNEVDLGFPIVMVPREYLPNFDFRNCCAVVVIGPDGLVANTAKYVGSLPILGVNSDPQRFDGILLPIALRQSRSVLQRTLKETSKIREVTMGEVELNDGQKLLAFNDFFIGCRTHISARYTLQTEEASEPQSSSGVIVATGAGSTGWLSSVFNMAKGVTQLAGGIAGPAKQMDWEDRRLAWVVREPFASRRSSANLVAGILDEDKRLQLESLMSENGIIFSDGIEADGIDFNSGSIATVRVAQQRARLVIG